MRGLPLAALILLILALAGYASQNVEAQPTEEEARQIFESIGCISCHTQQGKPGQPAASWDLIIQFMEEWSQKYPTIDEAIRNEVTYYGGQKFNSFAELMDRMSQNVGKTRSDPEIQQLEAFFRSFWGEQAGEAPTEQPTQTQTEAPAETIEAPEETPTGVRGGEEPKVGITLTVVSIAVVILITVVAAVYLTRR